MSRLPKAILGLLICATCVGGLTLSRAGANPDRDRDRGLILGSWELLVTPDGHSQVHGLIAFHQDGVAVGETVSSVNSGGYGSWDRTGSRRFGVSLTYLRFETDGTFVGRSKIRSALALDRSSTRGQGTFVTEIFDINGHLKGTITGTLEATRILPENF